MAKDQWNADSYALNAHYVPRLNQEVIQDLAPATGEQILDLGCGDGRLTVEIAQYGCTVTGIDSSPNLVAAAKKRGVNAFVKDAHYVEYFEAFDAVFSNAALHWMPHQDILFDNVFRALKPGGRFIAEMGGAGNILHLRTAITTALREVSIDFSARNPWNFPMAVEQHQRLERAGFYVTKCELRKRLTLLPTDMRGWLMTFGQQILSDLDPVTRDAVIDRIVELCRPTLCDEHGDWNLDYVRLNFVARKPQN